MNKQYKYITVLDYTNGQVYIYDYNKDKYSAKDFVDNRHDLKIVHYMVHNYKPALWTSDLYFCNREEAYELFNQKAEQ